MRANKAGLLNQADLVPYRNHHASHAQFFQSNSADVDPTEIYSIRVRLLMIVGLSLGLWVFIALLASTVI